MDQTDYFLILDEIYGEFYTLYDEFSGFSANNFAVEKDSFELRLVSSNDQRLRWLAGIFHTTDDLRGSSADYVPGFPEAVGLDRPDEMDYLGAQDQTLRETSIYGELAYDVTSAWEVSLGLRHFRLDDELEACLAFPIAEWLEGDELNLYCMNGKDDHRDNLARLSTRYEFSENQSIYFTVAEGFRRGGANSLPEDAEAPRGYAPDKVVNYELGGHSYWLDRQLRLSAAIFYIDWKDIHVYGVFDGRYSITTNAGRARSQGAELEALWHLSPNLSLRASYSLVDAELREDISAIDGENDVFAGDRLPGSPRDQWHLALDYQRPLGSALLDASLSVAHIGNITTQPNDGFYDYDRLSSYTLANARLGVSWRNWQAGAFVNNITDERAVTSRRSDYWYGGQGQFETITRPRTLGIFVSYTY
jgi:iron complex outermembrane receptor protein